MSKKLDRKNENFNYSTIFLTQIIISRRPCDIAMNVLLILTVVILILFIVF